MREPPPGCPRPGRGARAPGRWTAQATRLWRSPRAPPPSPSGRPRSPMPVTGRSRPTRWWRGSWPRPRPVGARSWSRRISPANPGIQGRHAHAPPRISPPAPAATRPTGSRRHGPRRSIPPPAEEHPTLATLAGVSRPSLVDVTEAALRQRLAPGRARPGDRLPPEKELAESMRVSRGTLRLALERLESNGEVNRRQGSGTFVGRVAMPPAFSEGLEVLESYTSLARRQGKRLQARDISIENGRTPGYVAEALGVRRRVKAPVIQRTLVADNTAVAHMRDIVHPDIRLPAADELRSELESGKMLLDVLI